MKHEQIPQWSDLPWDTYRVENDVELPEDTRPGRIVGTHGAAHTVVTPTGTHSATVSGRLSYLVDLGTTEPPVVGDYVAVRGEDTVLIEAVLPRQTAYRRKEAGERYEPQAICANCDAIAIVTTVPAEAGEEAHVSELADFNARRLERYLATLEPGVTAAVILNKADLAVDAEAAVRYAQSLLPGTRILAVSALDGSGVEAVAELVNPGQTLVVVGSSGTGKSTLIGRLIGTELRTTAVRDGDGRGRHTTTDRRVYRLPSGALLVDTPGMRELAIWSEDGEEDSLSAAFPEIVELASQCKFRDCSHTKEPHCAVQEAVRDGRVPVQRYQSFLQLRDEGAVTAAERRRRQEAMGKQISKFVRARKKAGLL